MNDKKDDEQRVYEPQVYSLEFPWVKYQIFKTRDNIIRMPRYAEKHNLYDRI